MSEDTANVLALSRRVKSLASRNSNLLREAQPVPVGNHERLQYFLDEITSKHDASRVALPALEEEDLKTSLQQSISLAMLILNLRDYHHGWRLQCYADQTHDVIACVLPLVVSNAEQYEKKIKQKNGASLESPSFGQEIDLHKAPPLDLEVELGKIVGHVELKHEIRSFSHQLRLDDLRRELGFDIEEKRPRKQPKV